MVCSEGIELNENERAFLNKGPGYMMRLELDNVEFELEMEKMVKCSLQQFGISLDHFPSISGEKHWSEKVVRAATLPTNS